MNGEFKNLHFDVLCCQYNTLRFFPPIINSSVPLKVKYTPAVSASLKGHHLAALSAE